MFNSFYGNCDNFTNKDLHTIYEINILVWVVFSVFLNIDEHFILECSGVHRSLGVHYSKVRSLTLDDLEPEILKVLAEIGNSVVNEVYEYNVPSSFSRATENCEE